jgi:hypothetical protein
MLEAQRRPRARPMRGIVAVIVGVACAVVLLQFVGTPRARLVSLEDVPPVVGELEQHINVEDAKSFLNSIRDKGLTGETLHPLGDLNPFTHQPEDPTNPESVLRRAKTRAIVQDADRESKQEMADAQQTARDFMGTDAGCTHEKEDQTDYAGEIAQSVSGTDCMDWQEAIALKLYNISIEPLSDGLEEPQIDIDGLPVVDASLTSNFCRNPYKQRIAAWCILASAKETLETTGAIPEGEGKNWEYCDVGSRCGVNVPILKAVPDSATAAAGALKHATVAPPQLKTGAGTQQQLKATSPQAGEGAPHTAAAELRAGASENFPAAVLRAEVGEALRGEHAKGPTLAAPRLHAQGLRGRAFARGGGYDRAKWLAHGMSSSMMVRRATNYEPQGRESLSHKQQLALVEEDGVEARAPRAGNDKQRESVARKSRKSIYAHGAIDGAKARALVGKVCVCSCLCLCLHT